MFTDGRATRSIWDKYNREADDAECAAVMRALETAVRRHHFLGRVTAYTDSQAVDEPDSHGVGWLNYRERFGRRAMPLPRPLAHLKREISEKRWQEAKAWAESHITGERMPVLPTRETSSETRLGSGYD